MTNEKRYEKVCAMLRAFDAASGFSAADMVIKSPQEWEHGNVINQFYTDAAQLLVEAKQGLDKQNTGAGRAAAITRVYKAAFAMPRENLRGCFPSGDKWAICDGHRFIRLNSKPESVPECFGGVDLEKLIPQERGEEVELPTAGQIKTAIAELKAKHGKDWKHEPIEALPGWWCNPQYLLDMVQALPNGKAYRPAKHNAPLYYESDDGDALLLPVRHASAA